MGWLAHLVANAIGRVVSPGEDWKHYCCVHAYVNNKQVYIAHGFSLML